ncbi:hypothetical protein [Catellatospora sp. NPDC049609]
MSEPHHAEPGDASSLDDDALADFVASADDTIDLSRTPDYEPFDDDEDY